ncbi:MAG TPA: lysophospholipid acyltransferase family protein [Capillimicrobium sp.]|jgi:1-acyl-sn-glycerol-3-phosphate acyltransferase
MADKLTPAYAAVMNATTPIVRWWGRMEVSGLEHIPESGPLLVVGNHDSYWDPIAIGMAARSVRQIHALAKSTLWKTKPVGWVLDGMGQIPIERGKGDVNAMQTAERRLREGVCIGVFPEGTRSLGRQLRARSGIGRLAEAVPEAQVLCCSVVGTVDIPAFPRRPRVRVRFFPPAGGGLQPGERHADFAARLVAEMRAEAPWVPTGRKKRGPKEPDVAV